jgi:hypothetical protein
MLPARVRQADALVEQLLVGDRLARARAGIRRHDQLGPGIVDARGQAVRREAAEHDRMDRADARAGQHGEDRFGDHRHVDQHAVAAAHAQARAAPRRSD